MYRVFILLFFQFLSFYGVAQDNKLITYKCLIEMNDYEGEGAYVVISLINPDGTYNTTLYVHGDDDQWYFDIKEWWGFYGKRRTDIDAITGATIAGSKRAICNFSIANDKVNKGYKLRFETAVEDDAYYKNDVELLITDPINKDKINGQGFIKFIRLLK